MEESVKELNKYKKVIDLFNKEQILDQNIEDLQQKLWYNLIEVRKEYIPGIQKAIRINLYLCQMLDEKKQIKRLLSPLFRLNHLFDQRFYKSPDNVESGLKIFYKILYSTYGNLDNFLKEIKIAQNMIQFSHKRCDKALIKQYNYLKNITLPVRGYENMRLDLFTILKKFNDLLPIVSNPEYLVEVLEETTEFKKIYILEYQKNHLYYQNRFNNFQRKIYTLPEYRALERLSSINGLQLKPVKEYINSFFSHKCEVENLEQILQKQTRCKCGFNLGEKINLPSLIKIIPVVKKGIMSYIRILQTNEEVNRRLKEYLRYHPNTDIKKILSINSIEDINGPEISSLISEDLIRDINKALNQRRVKISLQKLAPDLTGIYSRSELKILTNKIVKLINEKVGPETTLIEITF